MRKAIKYLLPATDINMGGLIIKQALPTEKVNRVDPFLLLHHAEFSYNTDAPAKHQGIGPHPHRGFSPVTFVVEGEVHHRDSRGNNQVAKKGEVQWMHAGAGIIHSERPSQDLVNQGGKQEIIQLWINSPADKKMQQPKYQFVKEDDFPVFYSADQSFKNKVVAGYYKDFTGAITPQSEALVIWSSAKKEGKQIYSIPEHFNAMIYVISGSLNIAGYGNIDEKNLAVFEQKNTAIELNNSSGANFLLLAGVPINEKVVQQGPFVMNSETEIMEAMRDYQMGKMGMLFEEG